MQQIELYDSNVSIELLGASGTNRNHSNDNDAGATNDAEAIRSWLSHHGKSSETLRKYTREARRLVIWAIGFQRKPVSSLNLADLQAYHKFLRNPPETLVGARSRIGEARWKPFSGGRTDKSVDGSMKILLSLFGYLKRIDYLKRNPMSELSSHLYDYDDERDASRRYLDASQINAIKSVLDRDDEAFVHRTRFAIALMLFLGMRIHEVTTAKMGGFQVKSDGTSWLRFQRKGRKWYTVPVPLAMLDELKRYRNFVGLSELPSVGDETPLVLSFKRPTKALGDRELRNDFNEICARAADLMLDEEKKTSLLSATPHSMRHVFATRALRRAKTTAQAHQVQQLMSHESLNTTMLYDEVEDKEQYNFVKNTSWE